ncbi:hypothetical protein LINGRAHAP2_LOCUS4603 [Linum grandiflorum]
MLLFAFFFRIRSYLAVRLCFGWLIVLAKILVGG